MDLTGADVRKIGMTFLGIVAAQHALGHTNAASTATVLRQAPCGSPSETGCSTPRWAGEPSPPRPRSAASVPCDARWHGVGEASRSATCS